MVAEIIVGVVGGGIIWIVHNGYKHGGNEISFWSVCAGVGFVVLLAFKIWVLAIISLIGLVLAAKEERRREEMTREYKQHKKLENNVLNRLGLDGVEKTVADAFKKIISTEINSRDYGVIEKQIDALKNVKLKEEFSKLDDGSKKYLEGEIASKWERVNKIISEFLSLEYVDMVFRLRGKYFGYVASLHRMQAYPKAFEGVEEYGKLRIRMEEFSGYVKVTNPMLSTILSPHGTQNDDSINFFKSKKDDICDMKSTHKTWLAMKNNFLPLLDKIPPNGIPSQFCVTEPFGDMEGDKFSWEENENAEDNFVLAECYEDSQVMHDFLNRYGLRDICEREDEDDCPAFCSISHAVYYREQLKAISKLFESVTDRNSGRGGDWFLVYPAMSMHALWHYALTTPFQPEAFRMAKEMYDFYFNIYDYPALDSVLAQAYVYSKVSPNMLSSMNSSVDGLLTYMIKNRKGDFCRSLASGFKWIGAREFEIKVLRAMLEAGLPEMDETLQKRLKVLLEPLREAPAIMASTELKTQSVSIDYAAKLWSNDDCLSFFKKLALEERALTYSLVFDEFNKTLPIANKWNYEEFAKFLCNETEKDYQGQITAENISIALLQQEGVAAVQEGVLLSPVLSKAGFDHAAVMFQATLIRQNITLKIYTLYMPPKSTVRKEQENITAQAMSLKTQSNPTVNELINDMRNFICEKAEEYLNSKNAGMQY